MTVETIKHYLQQIKAVDGEQTFNNRWDPDILCELIDIIDYDFRCCNCTHYFPKAKDCTKNVQISKESVPSDFGCRLWAKK